MNDETNTQAETENAEGATENAAKHSVVDPERKKNYTETRAASGAKSLNNGDAVASALAGLTVEQVYTVADGLFPDLEENLREKYAERNIGMQRMIVGNRIRAAVLSEKDGTPDIKALKVLTDPMQKANAEKAEKAEKEKAAAKAEKEAAAKAKKDEKAAA